MLDPRQRVIVALDGLDGKAACETIEALAPYVGMFKVGLELITRGDARQVTQCAGKLEVPIFYDGKFHDIAQTVANSIQAVCAMPEVQVLTVHCLGGGEMMEAARRAVDEQGQGKPPLILGVTILTSQGHDGLVEVGLLQPIWRRGYRSESAKAVRVKERVVQLACLARDSGLDGVVASPREIGAIRQACGADFIIVTPGVRPEGVAANGHKRIMTPGEAVTLGADYLVIGRPILKPANGTTLEAARRIVDEITIALSA